MSGNPVRPYLKFFAALILAAMVAASCSSEPSVEIVQEGAQTATLAPEPTTSPEAATPDPGSTTDSGAADDATADGGSADDAADSAADGAEEPVAGTEPTVEPTAAPTVPPDPFFIDGNIIRDPQGEPFLPLGTNVSAHVFPYKGWASDLVEGQSAYINTWGFNTLRVNIFCTDADFGKACTDSGESAGYEDLDEVIRAYQGTGVVTILDFHTLPFPFVPTADERERVVAYMTEKAELYKDNPYVWLQPYNEPLNECNLVKHGEGLDQSNGLGNASPTWLDIHVEAIDAIRATGNENPIVLNAGNWGQDICGKQGGFRAEESAILTFGPELIETYDNLLFDMHFYSRWSIRSDEEIIDYFAQIHAGGMAVVVGEIGGKTDGSQVQADDLKAAEAFYRLKIDGVGALSWHSSFGFAPVVNNGGIVDVDRTDGVKPTNLTQQGSLHWDFVKDPPAPTP